MGISMFLPSSCLKGTWNSFIYLETKLIKRNLEISMYLETKLFKRNKEISMYLATKLLIGKEKYCIPRDKTSKQVSPAWESFTLGKGVLSKIYI